jgi:hypothetical protein
MIPALMQRGSPLRKAALILGLSMLPVYWVLFKATRPTPGPDESPPPGLETQEVAEEEK